MNTRPKKLHWSGTYRGSVSRAMLCDWTFVRSSGKELPVGGKKHAMVVDVMSSALNECVHEMGRMEIEGDGSLSFELTLSEDVPWGPRWTTSFDGLVKDWIEIYCCWGQIEEKRYLPPSSLPGRDAIRAQLVRAIELLDHTPEGRENPEELNHTTDGTDPAASV